MKFLAWIVLPILMAVATGDGIARAVANTGASDPAEAVIAGSCYGSEPYCPWNTYTCCLCNQYGYDCKWGCCPK